MTTEAPQKVDVRALYEELQAVVDEIDDWLEVKDPLLDVDAARGFIGHARGWEVSIAMAPDVADGVASHAGRGVAVLLPASAVRRGLERALDATAN